MEGKKKGGLIRRAMRRGKRLIARHKARRGQKKLHAAFSEIKKNPPRSLQRQAEKYGKGSAKYEAMRRAIAFSKAGLSRKD